jgi:hypothetical protein
VKRDTFLVELEMLGRRDLELVQRLKDRHDLGTQWLEDFGDTEGDVVEAHEA